MAHRDHLGMSSGVARLYAFVVAARYDLAVWADEHGADGNASFAPRFLGLLAAVSHVRKRSSLILA